MHCFMSATPFSSPTKILHAMTYFSYCVTVNRSTDTPDHTAISRSLDFDLPVTEDMTPKPLIPAWTTYCQL